MKRTLIQLTLLGIVYIAAASVNKSWNPAEWSDTSILTWAAISAIIILLPEFVDYLDGLGKEGEEEQRHL